MWWVVKLRWNTGWQEIFIFCRSSNHFAFREVVKVKKSSAWNVSAKECFVDVVSSFSCQPSELRFTRKTRFWNRDLENRQKVLCTVKTGLRQEGHIGTKQQQTVGSTGTHLLCKVSFLHLKMEIGKLQFSNISLSFLGIFGRSDNGKKFPVSKEVLVGDQYLSKAWGKTFWAAVKELCIRASIESTGMYQHIPWLCTVKEAPGSLEAEDISSNLPTSPLEWSLW